jgi:hypothetical protein
MVKWLKHSNTHVSVDVAHKELSGLLPVHRTVVLLNQNFLEVGKPELHPGVADEVEAEEGL